MTGNNGTGTELCSLKNCLFFRQREQNALKPAWMLVFHLFPCLFFRQNLNFLDHDGCTTGTTEQILFLEIVYKIQWFITKGNKGNKREQKGTIVPLAKRRKEGTNGTHSLGVFHCSPPMRRCLYLLGRTTETKPR